MINEENKVPVTEQEAEGSPKPEAKKKLSTPVLVGIIAGAVAIIAVAVVLCVLLLGGCKNHVDANDDFLCDKCGDDFNDGIEKIYENVSFTLQLDDNSVLSGVKFSLTKGEDSDPITLTTDANGKVTYTLEAGKYTIEYDYESGISAFMSSDTYTVTVAKGMGEVVITFSDNTPDGSEEKPFYISENETEITLAPGAELHFNYRGAVTKYLTINNADLVVVYDGVEYTPVDGVIEVAITPKEIGVSTSFVVKNTSDSTVTEIMSFLAPLGSMDNPYNLNEDEECHVVPAESTIYYKYTAEKDAVLVVYVPDHEHNFVGITRILENDVPISSLSGEDCFAYMPIKQGDTITISVTTQNKEDTLVEFEGYSYTADESDPVDVLMKDIDVSYGAGESITYTTRAGNKVTILDEENVSVTYNGTTYTPDSIGKISFTVEEGCDFFTVTNTADNINGILITVEGTYNEKPNYNGEGSNNPESIG